MNRNIISWFTNDVYRRKSIRKNNLSQKSDCFSASGHDFDRCLSCRHTTDKREEKKRFKVKISTAWTLSTKEWLVRVETVLSPLYHRRIRNEGRTIHFLIVIIVVRTGCIQCRAIGWIPVGIYLSHFSSLDSHFPWRQKIISNDIYRFVLRFRSIVDKNHDSRVFTTISYRRQINDKLFKQLNLDINQTVASSSLTI